MMSKRDKVHTRRPTASTRQAAGFTLVELMVTLAVLIILLAIGVPQMRAFLLKRQVAADAETLAMTVQFAKSEALKRSGNVSICPLGPNTNTCATAATQDWSAGWMVFIDEGNPTTSPAGFDAALDTAIKVEQRMRGGTITFNQPLRKMTFQSNGLLNSVAGSFEILPGSTEERTLCKSLALSLQGRLRPGTCAAPASNQPSNGG